MSDDYGYFGSGSEGYAHYTAATEGDQKGQGGGGGGNKSSGGKPGCFVIGIIILVLFLWIFSLD